MAHRLGQRLKVPVFDLDDLIFEKKCTVDRPKAVRRELLHDLLITHDSWIIEGSSTSWTQEAVAAANIVISLEAPRPVLLFRLARRHLRRRFRKGEPEEDLAGFRELCTEVWQYKNPKYGQVQKVRELLAFANGERVVLHSQNEIEAFLARFPM